MIDLKFIWEQLPMIFGMNITLETVKNIKLELVS